MATSTLAYFVLVHENYDFFYGLEAELEELVETHNYIAGSYH